MYLQWEHNKRIGKLFLIIKEILTHQPQMEGIANNSKPRTRQQTTMESRLGTPSSSSSGSSAVASRACSTR